MRQPRMVKVPASWYLTKSFSAANCLLVMATYCAMLYRTASTSVLMVASASATACCRLATVESSCELMESIFMVTLLCTAWMWWSASPTTASIRETVRSILSSTLALASASCLLLRASDCDTLRLVESRACAICRWAALNWLLMLRAARDKELQTCSLVLLSCVVMSCSVALSLSSTSALEVPLASRFNIALWLLITSNMCPNWELRVEFVLLSVSDKSLVMLVNSSNLPEVDTSNSFSCLVIVS
mmetsp:Transcript_27268/g.37568  ORF Transcript_27268/g.37568 Transcript_27268/m.37568 type:complete len:245 (-) Transcript_27268:121-855(-)